MQATTAAIAASSIADIDYRSWKPPVKGARAGRGVQRGGERGRGAGGRGTSGKAQATKPHLTTPSSLHPAHEDSFSPPWPASPPVLPPAAQPPSVSTTVQTLEPAAGLPVARMRDARKTAAAEPRIPEAALDKENVSVQLTFVRAQMSSKASKKVTTMHSRPLDGVSKRCLLWIETSEDCEQRSCLQARDPRPEVRGHGAAAKLAAHRDQSLHLYHRLPPAPQSMDDADEEVSVEATAAVAAQRLQERSSALLSSPRERYEMQLQLPDECAEDFYIPASASASASASAPRLGSGSEELLEELLEEEEEKEKEKREATASRPAAITNSSSSNEEASVLSK
jgi:hypothetical protein